MISIEKEVDVLWLIRKRPSLSWTAIAKQVGISRWAVKTIAAHGRLRKRPEQLNEQPNFIRLRHPYRCDCGKMVLTYPCLLCHPGGDALPISHKRRRLKITALSASEITEITNIAADLASLGDLRLIYNLPFLFLAKRARDCLSKIQEKTL